MTFIDTSVAFKLKTNFIDDLINYDFGFCWKVKNIVIDYKASAVLLTFTQDAAWPTAQASRCPAGPSLQVWRAPLPKREGWEPREESLQLWQLLPTCFFYGHLQVFGIIPVVALVTTVDSGAVSRPLAFTAKVQVLCLFEAHLAGRPLDGLPEGAVTDVPSSIEPSQQANQ